MRIQTSSYFQPITNHSALLLQHYQIETVPLCFACICPAEDPDKGRVAGYLTEQFLYWFRDLPWRKLSKYPEKYILRAEIKLQRIIERTMKELTFSNLYSHPTIHQSGNGSLFPKFLSPEEQISFVGIFFVSEHFFLFCQGTPQIYLLNRNLGRGEIQCISDNLVSSTDEHVKFIHGLLQKDIGLLLATDTFCTNADRQELKDCLYVEDVQTEDRARRHLQELGRRSEARGGCHMGAVLIQTMTDEEI